MKKIVLLTLGLCLTFVLSSFAADDAKPDKTDRAARRAEQIKKYDKNGDGKLDESEKAAMKEDLKKQKKDAPAK